MTHDELRELTGGYALGVLDEPERRAFEAHVATCAECSEEVRELAAVATALALDVPQVDPPPALRQRVLDARLRATRSGVAGSPEERSGVAGSPEERSGVAGSPEERYGAAGPSEAPPRRQTVLAMLSAAAAVVALALGVYAVSLQRRIASLEQQLRVASDRAAQSQQQVVQLRAAADSASQVRRILAAGDVRRVDLAGTKAAPNASGRAYWSATEGLVVAFANLPATEAGKVYQLWVIPPGGDPIGAGLLDLQPDGRALALATTGASQRAGTVAITLEQAGGSAAPQGAILAAGTLN